MTQIDASYFEDLQGRLRALLINVAEMLPLLTVGLVTEMIDANECGVALEMMSEILVESEAVLDTAIVEDFAQLVEVIGLEPANVERLRALVVDCGSSECE
jgi:hypothetical protein